MPTLAEDRIQGEIFQRHTQHATKGKQRARIRRLLTMRLDHNIRYMLSLQKTTTGTMTLLLFDLLPPHGFISYENSLPLIEFM